MFFVIIRKAFKSLKKIFRATGIYGYRILWDANFYYEQSKDYNYHLRQSRLGPDWLARKWWFIKELRKRDENKCFWCWDTLGKRVTIDHIKPLSRGGASQDLKNMRLIHEDCRKQRDQAIYSGLVKPDWEESC